jgi:Fe2+ or Zn2+ uptake regulation protein
MECSDCGDVISFESKNICKKILEEAKKIGFEIKEHSISVI